jgi:hypothetical protein
VQRAKENTLASGERGLSLVHARGPFLQTPRQWQHTACAILGLGRIRTRSTESEFEIYANYRASDVQSRSFGWISDSYTRQLPVTSAARDVAARKQLSK